MTQVAGHLYTVEEFVKMPEYDERYELIDGRLVEKPMAKIEHALIQRLILSRYERFDFEEKVGRILPEATFRLNSNYAPTPDVSFWIASRKPVRKAAIAPIPDLAIEIQSPDQNLQILTDKAEAYIQGGVKLVWIIQPNKQIVAVFRQGQLEPETIQPGGVLDGEDVIPGFKLSLNALFEDEG